MPNVDNLIHDPDRNVRYNVKAYRKLTMREAMFAISQQKRRPKKNSRVLIVTTIGWDELR